MKKYFDYEQDDEAKTAEFYVFGDITAYDWTENSVSSYSMAQKLQSVPADYAITVHVNSPGGAVFEGLAIYNIMRERGNITTICDGYAASAASLVFCGGQKRIMNPASLVFIHQPSVFTSGTAADLRKDADDLESIQKTVLAAYKAAGVTVGDEKLTKMLDEETWISAEDAVEMGFATEVAAESKENKTTANFMRALTMRITKAPQPPAAEPDARIDTILQKLDEIDEKIGTSEPESAPVHKHKGFFNL